MFDYIINMNSINLILTARNDEFLNGLIRANNGKVPITRNLAANLGYNVNNVQPGGTMNVSYNEAYKRARRVRNGNSPVGPNRGTSPNRYTPRRRRFSTNSAFNFNY